MGNDRVSNPWFGPVKVRFGWQPKPTGWQPVLARIFEFVFIRVNSWLECAKQILWRSLVDAFAAGHDTC